MSRDTAKPREGSGFNRNLTSEKFKDNKMNNQVDLFKKWKLLNEKMMKKLGEEANAKTALNDAVFNGGDLDKCRKNLTKARSARTKAFNKSYNAKWDPQTGLHVPGTH
jgi:hypothetical protein